jgi:signal transduction histidine kinase
MDTPTTANPGPAGSSQPSKTILIVDDEAIIRDLCSKALKGYDNLQAGDGDEALALFEQGGIDVVLTDVMMPRMNGIELLKRIKEIDPTSVVIIMTGFAEKEVILNALKADADDFIPKPLNLLQLKTAVDKALGKKALKEELASLRNLDRLKTNFLSLISHKFRTPITGISLFLQNLSNGLFDPNEESFKRSIQMVYNEACYLERLVAGLLTFSRVMVNGDTLRLEPCDLPSLIMQVMTESTEVLSRIGLKTDLDLDPLPPVPVDREKLGFAVQQVIENAYKFSTANSTVSIALHQSGDRIVIAVKDSGIGIPKEDIPKVFEKFYQVDPSNTGQVRGFGLGLYYAKDFVRAHNGTIAIDSEPGKGTSVTITIPAPPS